MNCTYSIYIILLLQVGVQQRRFTTQIVLILQTFQYFHDNIATDMLKSLRKCTIYYLAKIRFHLTLLVYCFLSPFHKRMNELTQELTISNTVLHRARHMSRDRTGIELLLSINGT